MGFGVFFWDFWKCSISVLCIKFSSKKTFFVFLGKEILVYNLSQKSPVELWFSTSVGEWMCVLLPWGTLDHVRRPCQGCCQTACNAQPSHPRQRLPTPNLSCAKTETSRPKMMNCRKPLCNDNVKAWMYLHAVCYFLLYCMLCASLSIIPGHPCVLISD